MRPIVGEVEVTKVRADKPITELATWVRVEGGPVVLEGTAVCYTMPLAGPGTGTSALSRDGGA